ncbi:DNA replication and repair protein RecF [termite gut metagenome]|uniref:DNA replication and repair protein RecF n=1 Tax=termite gut metagenome TaxID=433724 RepID=A0A5J4QNH3_9ZZZZ
MVNVNKKRAAYIELTYVFDAEALKKNNPSSPFETDVYYCISIHPSGATGYFINEKLYVHHQNEQVVYLDYNNGSGFHHNWNPKPPKTKASHPLKLTIPYEAEFSGHELVLRQIRISHAPLHAVYKAIDNIALYNYFDTGSASELRRPSEFSSMTRLKKSGENMAQLLNYLKNNRTLAYDRIEKELTKINPFYKSIEFSNFSSQLYLSLRETNLDKTIGALHISDGTLRYLLLMSILYNPDRGYFIGLDEPENSLHPDMIKSICDMIKSAKAGSQFVVASHSPLLLNQFDLEDVLIFEKDEENNTIVKRVEESDFPDWEGDFLPGQMWMRGQIGGKRW